ncbi:MAG: right-handed parallel beta-helix repeat-containing protein [Bacteroidota bacterium]|jgi:parallel beta-helix repeat protein
MKNLLNTFVIVLLIVGIASSQTHPRLFYGPSDVATLQSRATTSGTPAYELWQLMKQRQADWFKEETRQIGIKSDPWQMHSLVSVALGYIITGDVSYKTATKNIIFGGGPITPANALVNVSPFAQSYPLSPTWSVEFYRTAQISTLSIVADILWNDLTVNERWQIGQKVVDEIDAELHNLIFSPTAHINNNHITRMGSALAFAAITFHDLLNEEMMPMYPNALSDLDRVRKLVFTDLDGKKNIIERLHDRQGSQVEGVMYGLGAAGRALEIGEAMNRHYGTDYLNAAEIQQRLSTLNNWLAYEVLPAPGSNGYFNNINDSDLGYASNSRNGNGLLSTVLALAGYYGTPTSRWVFENTVGTVVNLQLSSISDWQRFNVPQIHLLALLKYNQQSLVSPSSILPKSVFFADRGLVYVRTSNSWADNNDIQFAFEGAPTINPANNTFSIKHDQADKNHFTLHAFGKKFVTDMGYGPEFGGQRPENHNYILIDNKGEAIGTTFVMRPDSTFVEVDDWQPRPGKIVSYLFDGMYTFIHGDAKDAFSTLYTHDANGNPVTITQGDPYFTGKPNAYINPVLNADRFIMFNQAEGTVPAYAVIADDINRDNLEHIYRWLLHSNYGISVTDPMVINAGGGDLLTIWQTSSSTRTITSTALSMPTDVVGVEENLSLSAPATDSYEHAVLNTGVVNPYFHTVLYPSKTGMLPPTVSYPSTVGGSGIKLVWSGYEDYSLFRYSSGNVSTSNIITDGKLTQVRRTSAGAITSFSMGEGTSLTDNGATLIQTYGAIATVMYSGTKVTISGSVSDFSVYAPNATTLEINGSSANFIRAGNYIESTTISHNRNWGSSVTLNFNTTIAAGVTLQFAPFTSLFCNAKFTVNGTSTSPVVFTGSNWYGIIISGSGANNSQINYATINNVRSYGGSALYITNASNVAISHCTITNNVNYGTTGIGVNNAGNPQISYNIISNNGGYGISYYNSSGDLWQNTFQNNPYGAIRLTNSSPTFGHSGVYSYNGNNVISGGSYGIYATNYSYPWVGSYGNTMVGYNSITESTVARVNAATYSEILSEQNWWGSSSPPSSWFQKDASSIIEYNPWLSAPPGQQSAELANNETIPMTTSQNVSEINAVDFRKVREAIAIGKPEQAIDILSTGAKNGKNKEIFDRIIAEFVVLLQAYPENENVRALIPLLQDNASQSNFTKINLGRLFALSNEHAKAIQLFQEAKGNDDSKMEFKLAGMDEFFVNLSRNNINDAELNLSELQTHFKNDENVKEIVWMYELIKGNASENSNHGGSKTIAKNAIVNYDLDNFPNPFNPSTTISYSIVEPMNVELKVYDYLGREITTLVNEFKSTGIYKVQFNANTLAGGVYFYTLKTGNTFSVKKMLFVK